MSELTSDDVQWYPLLDSGDPEAVAQFFWTGLSTANPGFVKQSLDVVLSSYARIGSKAGSATVVGIGIAAEHAPSPGVQSEPAERARHALALDASSSSFRNESRGY